jgi:hypothetical protein
MIDLRVRVGRVERVESWERRVESWERRESERVERVEVVGRVERVES